MSIQTEGFIAGIWTMWIGIMTFLVINRDEPIFWEFVFCVTFLAIGLTIIRIVEDWYCTKKRTKRYEV
jgi:hypothetical protein